MRKDTSNSPGWRRIPSRRDAELFDGQLAFSLRSGNHANRAVSNQRRNGIGRWRSIAEISAQRGPVLNLCSPDQEGGIHQPRVGPADDGMLIDSIARHRRAERQAGRCVVTNLQQLGNAFHIDHQIQIAPFLSEPERSGRCLRSEHGHGLPSGLAERRLPSNFWVRHSQRRARGFLTFLSLCFDSPACFSGGKYQIRALALAS